MENENELLLKQKIQYLEQEIEQLKEHLKKYTAPTRSKLFYENHKNYVLQKNKEYKDKTNYYSNLSNEKKKCKLILKNNCTSSKFKLPQEIKIPSSNKMIESTPCLTKQSATRISRMITR